MPVLTDWDEFLASDYVENLGGDVTDDGVTLTFNVDPLSQDEVLGLTHYILNCAATGKPGRCPGAAGGIGSTHAGPVAPAGSRATASGTKVPGAAPAPAAPAPPSLPVKPAPTPAPAPAPAPAKTPTAVGRSAGKPPDAPKEGGGEGGRDKPVSQLKGKKFSGETKDKRGYRICFTEGRRSKCAPRGGETPPETKRGKDDEPAPTDKGKGEPPPPEKKGKGDEAKPADQPKDAEKAPPPKPGESAKDHTEQAKAHAAAATAALKAGKHDEALEHVDKAHESIKKAGAASDAQDAHKVNADNWGKQGGAVDKFKEKVADSRRQKVEGETKAKADKDAQDKAAKEHEEKARAAKELEDKAKGGGDKQKQAQDTANDANAASQKAKDSRTVADQHDAAEKHLKAAQAHLDAGNHDEASKHAERAKAQAFAAADNLKSTAKDDEKSAGLDKQATSMQQAVKASQTQQDATAVAAKSQQDTPAVVAKSQEDAATRIAKSQVTLDTLKDKIKGMSGKDAIRTISETLKGLSQERKGVQVHGMTDAEDMHSVNVHGIHLSWAEGLRGKAAKSVHNLLKGVPDKLLGASKEMVFTSQQNKDDEFWKKTFGMASFKSAATGGDGRVCVYNGSAADSHIFTHESGHNLAQQTWGNIQPPKESEYGQAQQKEKAVSEYGKNSPAEDFAEACTKYATQRASFKRNFPMKFAALKKILGD